MALTEGCGKHQLGTEVLRKACLQYPGDFWIYAGLNGSIGKLGPEYEEEAIGFLRAALALRPNDAFTWIRIGEVNQSHYKRMDEANACYRKAIELEPKNNWFRSRLGPLTPK